MGCGKVKKLIFQTLSILLLCYFGAVFSETLEINDPFTNGSSIGQVSGGTFTDSGWKTSTMNDYIQYDIETCPKGRIEFDVVGLFASNDVFPNIGYNRDGSEKEDMHYTLFNMWDRDDADYWYGETINGFRMWHNPYKAVMHLFGYVYGDAYKWGHGRFRLNVSAFEGGYDDDPHAFEVEYGMIDWQQEQVYHFELEWGDGAMKYYVDDVLYANCDYSSFGEDYAPPSHSMRIGSSMGCKGFGHQVPQHITFSNFEFYRIEDHDPPEVTSYNPNTNDLTGRDPYIAIVFNEAVDLTSAQTAFSISPSIAGSVDAAGSSIYFNPDGLLEPGTTYTITLSTDVTDKAGNNMASPLEFSFTTEEAVPEQVGRYEVFDLAIVAPNLPVANKYTQVYLTGVFQGPTETIEIAGFWDGGDVWRVRMAPTEVGTWTYTVNSTYSELQTSGSFECIESDSKGFLRKNPDNPYTFMYDDGTPWFWKGETSWRMTTTSIPFEGRFKPYIDLRAEQGYNAVQHILVSYINGDAFWKNEGGYVFELNYDSKNYDKINPDYFKWVDVRYEYALSKGVVPVMLFTWAQEFAKFSDAQFERYEKYLVSRYAAYNVIWVISGEYDEVYVDYGIPASTWENHGQLVYNADPYKHLITLHPTGRSSCREFGYTDWLGFIMQQGPYWHDEILRDRIFDKPVVNGEYAYAGWHDDEDVRIGAWEILTAGGHITAGFFTTFAPDKGGWDMAANEQEQNVLKWALAFWDKRDWKNMVPSDDLVNNGYCLAKPGEDYVAYSRDGGPVTINLAAAEADLPGRWLNPRTGEYSSDFNVTGGTSSTLTPPFAGDWVLHVGYKDGDSEPPAAPTGIKLTKNE